MDSVVLVSAFITSRGLAAELLMEVVERGYLWLSEAILNETRRVLIEREHLRRRFSYNEAEVERFIKRLRTCCRLVQDVSDEPLLERDPEDDKILACALAAEADYLVSRDLDLLDLEEFRGIQIISPEEFIQCLRDG